MKKQLLLLCFLINAGLATAQVIFAGYEINDYLVSAVHPNGWDEAFVTGLPDDFTWVDFNEFPGDPYTTITGTFGLPWPDDEGDELLIETSFRPDNYRVSLLLTTGEYSDPHFIVQDDWLMLAEKFWGYVFTSCTFGDFQHLDMIVALDFDEHFGLTPLDTVVGIETEFLPTPASADFAGHKS